MAHYDSRFIDRGDPASADFAVGDFTTDLTWCDLDLSSIVPAGAKAVVLKIEVKDGSLEQFVQFRKNGNSNIYANFLVYTQTANIRFAGQGIVPCDANRVIEYRTANTTFTNIDVTVLGWFV